MFSNRDLQKAMMALTELSQQNGFAHPEFQSSGAVLYAHLGDYKNSQFIPEVVISSAGIRDGVIGVSWISVGDRFRRTTGVEMTEAQLTERLDAEIDNYNRILRALGFNEIIKVSRTHYKLPFDWRPRNIKSSVTETLNSFRIIDAHFQENTPLLY